jgi:hypothetical protein
VDSQKNPEQPRLDVVHTRCSSSTQSLGHDPLRSFVSSYRRQRRH